MGQNEYPLRSSRDAPVPFPRLHLGDWRATRDTLHGYARVVGKVRATLMPKQKHWWHTSLQAAANGLTTTPIPVGARTLVLTLDMVHHRLLIATNLGEETLIPLRGQPSLVLFEDTLSALARLDIEPDLDPGGIVDGASRTYDSAAVEGYWRALSRIDGVFKRFKGTLRQETSPVQMFTHHFDLSLNWFSGRLVPGMDPADEESADEQMNFGFVSGDAGIEEAYFYATAYPPPEGWTESPAPAGAYWHTQGWTGAVLMYERLTEIAEPERALMDFLTTSQRAGARLMT
jgi:hypothetical protein